jgi:GGDEF domain-containing protein
MASQGLTDFMLKQRLSEERNHQSIAARTDVLTGLANRSLILEKLDEALQRGRSAQGGVLALLVIDLDGFKEVNDTLGHVVGDELLRAVAERSDSGMWSIPWISIWTGSSSMEPSCWSMDDTEFPP